MVVPVPESVLKKSKTLASIQEKRQAALKKLVAVSIFYFLPLNLQKKIYSIILFNIIKKRKAKRKVIFNRAKTYAKEYRALERTNVRNHRLAKEAGNFLPRS